MQTEVAFDWFSPIASLKGVGDKMAEKLVKLQIITMGDLLLHCPFRYEDRTHLTPIKDLQAEKTCVIQGRILQNKVENFRKKRCILTLADESGGVVQVVFFHYLAQKPWKIGASLRCFGQIKAQSHFLQMVHPEVEFIDDVNFPMPSTLTAV
ncbi:MAG TPA: hypothetical protein PLD88_06695, partial [Candidatus Berkiella sp.]|nr:hypothetical protein [Candidatus Berkiella sp.]